MADCDRVAPRRRNAAGYDAAVTSPYPTLARWMGAAVPAPLRLLLLHALIGYAVATLFVLAILWRNLFGLAGLMLRAPEHPLPLALLWFFIGLTFAGAQMGIAIMAQAEDGDDS